MYNSLISYKKEAFKELDSLAEILNIDEDKHSDIELQIDINAKDSMNMKISDFVSMCLLLAEA